MTCAVNDSKDEYAQAVEAGDLDRLRELFHNEKSCFGFIFEKKAVTPLVWATTLNAARRDSVKLQRDILHRILCMQSTLLDRVETKITDEIAAFDARGHFNELPEIVTNELLPRYGKIASEIFGTMKLLQKIESPSAPAPSTPKGDADDA